ncbi:hypothetical protein FBU59_006114 [Linderina macrospora]|uniref:Uncharacterized protein n=1 Tax=Linderina macrospora TaxID=4868 RepID=A0ACC1J0N4_9FUNG|nr:hypothetical protein FBU59_006114 [Linderina macrospora]
MVTQAIVPKAIATANGSAMMLRTVNAVPHITLCVGAGAKAVQSNAMLKMVFGEDNADLPQNCPPGWAVVPVMLTFEAVLNRFMA